MHLFRYESFTWPVRDEWFSSVRKKKKTTETKAHDSMSRIGFLTHPNCEMMRTLSDKAVTNQSHCKSRTTVKDISGPSSDAMVKTQTCHSKFARSSKHTAKLFALAVFYFSPSQSHCSLSLFFVIVPSCAVLLVEARRKGHRQRWEVAVCYRGFWSEEKKKYLPQNTPLWTKLHNSCWHVKMSFNYGIL